MPVPAARGLRVLSVLGALLLAGAASAPAAPARARSHPPRPTAARHRTLYVSATARPRGDGSRRRPFATLAAVAAASRPGDEIVVLPAPPNVAPLDGGIALQPDQTLRGGGGPVARALGGPHPGWLPRIANTLPGRQNGDAVELADRTTVTNLVIGPAVRGGIYGRGVRSVTVRGNDLSATNTSCTTGFVVQPFNLPTLIPGVGVPFATGLANGWAAVMVDESSGREQLRILGNTVHDAACADGIDVRASGTARVGATVTGNALTRLAEGATQQSILAIGMQTTGTARLVATLSDNRESYIGSATAGDFGDADSEGLFVNSAGHSQLTERIDHNVFAHGLGHLSANCVEVIASNGGPAMDVHIRQSTCDHVVGDVIEAVNLSPAATMALSLDRVRAADSELPIGPVFHQAEPGDDGICMFELSAGAGSSTSVDVRRSVFTGCVTDGFEAAAAVDDGSGPAHRLAFDIRDSRITGNALANLRVIHSAGVDDLAGRVQHTDLGGLSGTSGSAVILQNLDSSGTSRVRLDFGGGPLGSPGGNCIFGGHPVIEDQRETAAAADDWWGTPAGPGALDAAAAGGAVDTSHPLPDRPAAVC